MYTVYHNNIKHNVFFYNIEWSRLHRDGDLPAIICASGSQQWYKNGSCHRNGDLPAIIWADGSHAWYKNGLRHRNGDLPAIIWENGTREWYKNGIMQKDGYKLVSKQFNLYTFLYVQFFLRYIYIFRYNKQIWSPSNLAGIHTKNSLMKLFLMKREKN